MLWVDQRCSHLPFHWLHHWFMLCTLGLCIVNGHWWKNYNRFLTIFTFVIRTQKGRFILVNNNIFVILCILVSRSHRFNQVSCLLFPHILKCSTKEQLCLRLSIQKIYCKSLLNKPVWCRILHMFLPGLKVQKLTLFSIYLYNIQYYIAGFYWLM